VKGLDDFRGAHPPVAPVFFSFRAMVGIGVLMLVTSWSGWWIYRRRGWVASALPRGLLWVLTAMTFSGWLATLAGWYVTEIGRQPFIVYGLLHTADVASKVPSAMIASTLAMYIALYIALIVAYIGVIQYMAEKALDDEPRTPQSGSAVAAAARRAG
jgi:cytochrome d ubiquinol oxidase subunit I